METVTGEEGIQLCFCNFQMPRAPEILSFVAGVLSTRGLNDALSCSAAGEEEEALLLDCH